MPAYAWDVAMISGDGEELLVRYHDYRRQKSSAPQVWTELPAIAMRAALLAEVLVMRKRTVALPTGPATTVELVASGLSAVGAAGGRFVGPQADIRYTRFVTTEHLLGTRAERAAAIRALLEMGGPSSPGPAPQLRSWVLSAAAQGVIEELRSHDGHTTARTVTDGADLDARYLAAMLRGRFVRQVTPQRLSLVNSGAVSPVMACTLTPVGMVDKTFVVMDSLNTNLSVLYQMLLAHAANTVAG